MPFTFAHPAIVIPINKRLRKFFSLTALVIGSMAPDFEYFIRFKPVGLIGHTFLGFFYFNLPLCFLVAYLFHYIVKRSFILNMPQCISKRYSYLTMESWGIHSIKELFIFIYSAIVGMLSHVIWDAFTHNGGRFVGMIPLLSKRVCIMNYKIPVYKLAQHGSTLIGFMIIFYYLYSIRSKLSNRVSQISPIEKLMYWMFIFLGGIGMVFYRISSSFYGCNLKYIGSYIVSFINGLFIGLVIVSLVFKFCFNRRQINHI
ncbi:DUF4184 family protein [Lutibacter sp. B2]|nr:DUF4184 family protein [Lutibacter sp. B2]